MPPTFLTLGEVLEIHRDQIGRYGGAAGIRDLGLLQSALAQPRATFGGKFLHGDRVFAAQQEKSRCDRRQIGGSRHFGRSRQNDQSENRKLFSFPSELIFRALG
jgi:hypothetical protein